MHSIGIADMVTYDAGSGDTVLIGNPEVTQGLNRCIATDHSTKIYLNKDGHMRTVGPHKSLLVEEAEPQKPGAEKPGKKQPTEPTVITALESTFDQKANVAVFIGSVVVKDPQFNVICDKMTAYLKHDDKNAGDTHATAGKKTPKLTAPNKDDSSAAEQRGGGLDKAIAITTSERRVIITQDKIDAAGNVIARNYSIGNSDKATYDGTTRNTVLTGSPEVTQGSDRCVATDPTTVIILNRDGRMKAIGPHRTLIIEESEPVYPGSELKVTRAVARSGLIVRAVLLKLGLKQPGPPGANSYENTDFKVTQCLEGKCGDTVSVTVNVMDHDAIHELTPEAGNEYIVFIASQLDQQQVAVKLLLATSRH